MKLLQLIETPDYSLKGDVYEQKDAVAFTYFKSSLTLLFYNKLIHKDRVFSIDEINSMLQKNKVPFLRTHGMINYLTNALYYNTHSWVGDSKLNGRLWLDNKIISFWNLPFKSEFKKFKIDFYELTNIKIDSKWIVELHNKKSINASLYNTIFNMI